MTSLRPFLASLIVVLSLSSGTLRAADAANYKRFLLPIYVGQTPGAYGSLWEVETWFYYSGSEPFRMYPRPFCYFTECTEEVTIEAGWPALPYKVQFFPETAVLVHVERPFADQISFNSRARDLARQDDSAGTEIPVVSEDAFRSRPVYLLNVPVQPKFRTMIRTYALPEIENPEVEIRYYRQPFADGTRLDTSIILLRSERVRLRTHRDNAPLQASPSIAEIGNVHTLPQLAGESAVWIEVVPVTPGLRIWAFLSVTNDVTQQVTVVSPSAFP